MAAFYLFTHEQATRAAVDLARSSFAQSYGKRIDLDSFELSFQLKSTAASAYHLEYKIRDPSEASPFSSGLQDAHSTIELWAGRFVRAEHTMYAHKENISFASLPRPMPRKQAKQGSPILFTKCLAHASLEERAFLAVEARLLALLDRHPHIVSLIAHDMTEGLMIFATERPQKGTLRAVLCTVGDDSPTASELRAACVGIASAMAYLESLDIVHRALSLDAVAVYGSLEDVKLMRLGESVPCPNSLEM
jgi:hypothetical protein